LGAYALYLNLKGDYRIHGTDIDKIFGIGMQITHGCVRMYPEDIEALYNGAPVGTPVYIVKQPIKVGWLNNTLYLEAHPDLEGEEKTPDQRYAAALVLIQKANKGELPEFDQVALNQALKDLDGVPVPLYERLPPLEDEMPAIEPELIEEPVAKAKKPAVAPATKKVKAAVGSKKKDLKTAKKSDKKEAKVAVAPSKKQTQVVAAKEKKTTSKDTTTKTKTKAPSSPGGYYHGS
jgi:L,D-transpeptidase ErfK/SrfK